MHLETGSRLGPYEILGPIGAGGMGEVYRARDTRLGREVAVKVLPLELSRDKELLARFEREARSASALNHPNIVTIHDFNTGDGEAWLVMELVRGESLRDIVDRGPVPVKKLLSLAGGIADGLAAAHAAGVVHRDLKPENVMVTGDGTPKILDFGLVKQTVAGNTGVSTAVHSQPGIVMGTAAYMSPEQARGAPLDFRTDQFSLGLMLHEMATGRNPFRRASGVDTTSAILNDEPEPLDESFPDSFVAIVERCLSKNPSERYGSTSDLAHDVARLRSRTDRFNSARPRDAWPAWTRVAFSALLLVAIASFALLAVFRWQPRQPAPADPVQGSIATPEVPEILRDEIAAPLALSPDGRYLVVNGTSSEGKRELWLHDLRTGSTRIVAEDAYAPAWSSDSRSVAYFADGKLKTIPIDRGPARVVCEARAEGTPTWAGDTILYVQYSRDPGVYRVSAGGGKPERVVSGQLSEAGVRLPWWPAFLPDGRKFLYLYIVNHPGQTQVAHELMVGSLDGSAAKRVPGQFDSRAVYVDGQLLFVRDGTLMAQPFDADKVQFTSEAKPIVDGVYYFRNTGNAAFTASGNGELAWCSLRPPSRLAWLDRTGVEVKLIGKGAFNGDGRLSPDGNRYAVGVIDAKSGAGDVWIYDLTRDSAQRLTFLSFDEKVPVWSPDGGTIYYRVDGQGPPDIAQWRLGDDHGSMLLKGPEVEEPQDASPDGKWLLYVVYTSSGSDLKVLPLSPPGPPRPFIVTPFNEFAPRFSPEGRSVAYVSDVSGRPEIYVRPFAGSAASVRVSNEGGTHPRWRRDGTELFFLAPDGRLMTAPMSRGVPGGPKMLFQAASAVDFDVSPDGTRFVVQLEAGNAEPPIHMLINWPARVHLAD